MPKMIALKRRRYESKLVNVNDIFDVRSKDVRLLKAMKWAIDYVEPPSMVVAPITNAEEVENFKRQFEEANKEYVPIQVEEPQASPDPVLVESVEEQTDANVEEEATKEVTVEEEMPTQAEDYISMLRKRATALGISVDGRWSYTRLQREIDEHNKKTYQRADLRAEE